MMELRELQNKQAAADTAAQVWILRPLRDQPGLAPLVIPEGEMVIGAAANCEYPLPMKGVAASHCRLIRGGDRLQALSEDSRTWLNDGPFHKASLKSGDRLTIGPVTFRVERSARAHTPLVESSEDSRVSGDALSDSHLLRYLRRAIERDPSAEHLTELDAPQAPREGQPLEHVFEELRDSLHQTQQQAQIQQAQLRELEQRHPDKMPAETHAESSVEIPLPVSASTPSSVSPSTPVESPNIGARLQELQQQLLEYQARDQQHARQRDRWRKLRTLRRAEQRQAQASLRSIRDEQDRQREQWLQRESGLQQQLAELEQESLTQRQHQAEREQALRQETVRLSQRFEQLEQSLSQVRGQESETLTLLSSLQQKLAEEASRATDWERERSAFHQERDRLQDERDQLQEQMRALKQNLHASEQQLNSTQQQLTSTEQQLTSARQQQAEQEESLQRQQSLLAEKEADLQALVAERETLQLQLAEQAAELDAVQRDFNEANRERAELDARCQQLLDDQQNLQHSWETEREQAQAALAAVEADLEQTRQALQHNEQEQREAAEQATHDQDAAWEKIAEERDRLFQLRQELQQEHTAFTQARQDLAEVRAEVEQQRQELRQRQQEFHEKQERWYELHSEQENNPTPESSQEPTTAALAAEETDPSEVSPQPPEGAGVDSAGDAALADADTEHVSPTEASQQDSQIVEESAPSDSEISDALSEFFSTLDSPDEESNETAPQQVHEDDTLQATDFEELVEPHAPETTEMDALESDTIATWTDHDTDVNADADPAAAEELAELAASTPAEAESETDQESVESAESPVDSSASESPQEQPSNEETDEELDKLRRELAEMFGLSNSSKPGEQAAASQDANALSDEFADAEQSSDLTDPQAESDGDQLPLLFGDESDEVHDTRNSHTTTGTLQNSLLATSEETLTTIDPMDDSADVTSAVSEAASQPAQQATTNATISGTTDVVVEDIEDAESVAAYMERLFARTNGRQNYSAPAQTSTPTKTAAAVSPPATPCPRPAKRPRKSRSTQTRSHHLFLCNAKPARNR